ncbi:MAG: hypothetical protein V4773_16065 [Verrucomicrobiota bacterium]
MSDPIHTGHLRPRRLIGLLLAALLASVAFAAEQRPLIRFSDLPQGDTLFIAYSASGCFTWEAADFTYTSRAGGSFTVSEFLHDPNLPRAPFRIYRGTVQLEPGDTAKLDALLALYRAPVPKDHLTLIGPAIPVLRIQQRRGSRVIAEEMLQDKQLAPTTEVLTFDAMLSSLRQAAVTAR